MEKILLKKGEGKTTELIKLSDSTGNYIVCHSMDEASRIHAIAYEMGLNIPFPLSYYEFRKQKYYSKGIKGFLIDNVEMLVQYFTDVPINAITLTI